jgi:methyl-accepting chemotaxis protein
VKFRTKIWMLPASAALVFAVGTLVSYLVGASTSDSLHRLRTIDDPMREQVMRVDRGIEQFRLTLQSAAAEGDADKLKEVQVVVDKTHEVLKTVAAIDGKSEQAAQLLAAFDAYQSVALGATRAMLGKGEMGDQVARMQAAQGALDKLVKAQVEASVQATSDRRDEANSGVRTALWVNLATALVVLGVLGVASKLIVSSVWGDLGEEPDELHKLMHQIAGGDLQHQPQVATGDQRSLNAALGEMMNNLRRTVGTIRQATDSIATASREIEAGNLDLSTRTESTASNLQSTASSVVHLNESVRQSADSAQQANQLASAAATAAQRGGDIMAGVVTNMTEISTASRKIGEIIGVIDGIAFQTNILALNAAVEAARAGEQGRGFAVVAGEVRSLAQRSAQAAREIKSLIGASSEKVDGGTRLVNDAGSAMQEIVGGVRRVTDIIGEISAAATEQSAGIGQVNGAVSELDRMTQQNAALVEESAAAASSMREQAGRLAEAVATFRLGNETGADALSSAVAPVRMALPVKSAAKPAKAAAPASRATSPAPVRAAQPAAAAAGGDDDWAAF